MRACTAMALAGVLRCFSALKMKMRLFATIPLRKVAVAGSGCAEQTIKNHPAHNHPRGPAKSEEVMHMGTRRHEKTTASKPEGRKFAGKKHVGRGLRIAKNIGKGVFALLGVGAPLLLEGQTKDAQPIKPGQENVRYVASNDQTLPASTYVAGPDTLSRSDRVSPDAEARRMEAASKGAKNPEPKLSPPSPKIYGEKFCEANVNNNVVRITMTIDHKTITFETMQAIFDEIGLPNASEKDIAAKVYEKTSNKIHFITRKGIVTLTLDMESIKKIRGVGIYNSGDRFDASYVPNAADFFVGEGEYYVSADGSQIVMANPDFLMAFKPGCSRSFKFDEMIGIDIPSFERPTKITTEGGWIRIEGSSLIEKGEMLKLLFDLRCIEEKIRIKIKSLDEKAPPLPA